MASSRKKLTDKDLAIKLTDLSLNGINLTWSAVVLREPYHRVLRVAKDWSVPYAGRARNWDGERVTNRPWTKEEDEIISDRSVSVRENAILLHRTDYAVARRRFILSKAAKEQNHDTHL